MQVLVDEIERWKPRVADIRSSTARLVAQSEESEHLCERISAAMARWEVVCIRATTRQQELGNKVLYSDEFRLSVDELLSELSTVQDDIQVMNVGDPQTADNQRSLHILPV